MIYTDADNSVHCGQLGILLRPFVDGGAKVVLGRTSLVGAGASAGGASRLYGPQAERNTRGTIHAAARVRRGSIKAAGGDQGPVGIAGLGVYGLYDMARKLR